MSEESSLAQESADSCAELEVQAEAALAASELPLLGTAEVRISLAERATAAALLAAAERASHQAAEQAQQQREQHLQRSSAPAHRGEAESAAGW